MDLGTPLHSFAFQAIGTHWVIDIYSASENLVFSELHAAIAQRIEEFDAVYSRFRSDSLVARMSARSGEYALPDDAQKLFDIYQRLYTLTQGSFTPLIGNTLEQAGYDPHYSLISTELTRPLSWEKVLQYEFPKLIVIEPAMLDFGAAGKGYLVDIVSDLIQSFGIVHFCVDAGGDMVYKSADRASLTVALEDPGNTSQAIGTIAIHNQALCASSGNRRAWGAYTHIIDPRTLESPKTIAATWVTASTALVADALATCLFLEESTLFTAHFQFEYLILYTDYSIAKSPGFAAELFVA